MSENDFEINRLSRWVKVRFIYSKDILKWWDYITNNNKTNLGRLGKLIGTKCTVGVAIYCFMWNKWSH